jgi:lipoprotein-releasing system permease protein
MSNPTEAFSVDSLLSPGVVFQVKQGKYDRNYIITSLDFAQRLFHSKGEVSSMEFRLKAGEDVDKVKEKMKAILGPSFTVKDRYEQQADTFKIMKVEKLFAYIFLTFILVIACFNIIGSLSMLIIDKQSDIITLRNLGATDKQIRRVFLFEGRMISVAGAVIGIAIGLFLCWLQQTYGIVRLGDQAGNFVVNAYPISVHPLDIVLIFFTVIAVGWLAVWYPVRRFTTK